MTEVALPPPPGSARASRGVPRLSAAMYVVAGLLLVVAVPQLPHGDGVDGWWPWLLVAAACAAAELMTAHLHIGRQTITYSLSDVPLVVGLVFLDPTGLVLARLAGAGLAIVIGRWRRPVKLVFNVANMLLETVLAALAWHLVLSEEDPIGPRGWLAALSVLVATEVSSSLAVTAAIRLDQGRVQRQTLPELLAGTVMAGANVSLAVLVVALVQSDWRLVWALVVLGAVLVIAYRAHTSLRRRHDGLERLAGYTGDITGELRTDAVADAVVSRAGAIVDAEVVELDWWGGEATAQVRVVIRGGRAASVPALAALFGAPGPEPLLVARHVKAPELRQALAGAGLRDAVVAPLVVAGRVRGTLLVGDRQGEIATFSTEDANFVQTLANQAAAALANAELADRLRDEAEQRRHEALHDALTALPNRTMFRQALGDQVLHGQRAAVMLLDLDRFKEVNDTLGHHLGDELLKQVAARLVETLPKGSVVARLGGDEFTVLLPDVEEGEAVQLAARLRADLLRPILARDLTLHTDCSVGIALTPQHGQDVDVLLQRADVAMYAAKEDHSGFAVYSPQRDQYNPRRLAMVADLREAINHRGLQVYYQPKVDLASGRAIGVEALIRWNHAEYGFIPPDEFLPIAEQTDLMLPLTLLVLRRALEDLAVWEGEGTALSMAVNLSPRVLLEATLIEHVAALLRSTGLRPERLTLEITEGSVIADPTRTIAVLEQLDAMGVRLSIDDFGTGYSSLSYLRRLPIHEVKIDKSFVMELTADGSDAAIVQSTVDLAHRLGMRVVAEGVETAGTAAILLQMGCDIAQGYLLSRPVPAGALAEWAQQWPAQAAATLQLLAPVADERSQLPSGVTLLRRRAT